jgi:hypothetical protein
MSEKRMAASSGEALERLERDLARELGVWARARKLPAFLRVALYSGR